jgi:hypothetical protein
VPDIDLFDMGVSCLIHSNNESNHSNRVVGNNFGATLSTYGYSSTAERYAFCTSDCSKKLSSNPKLEIVSDDDNDNDSLFDTLMIVCQQESSSDSSGDEDKETGETCVWGDLDREGFRTTSANVCSILTCCSRDLGDRHQFTHLITSSFFQASNQAV